MTMETGSEQPISLAPRSSLSGPHTRADQTVMAFATSYFPSVLQGFLHTEQRYITPASQTPIISASPGPLRKPSITGDRGAWPCTVATTVTALRIGRAAPLPTFVAHMMRCIMLPANSWHRRALGRAALASWRMAAPSSSRLAESLPFGPPIVVLGRPGSAPVVVRGVAEPTVTRAQSTTPVAGKCIHSNAPPSFTSSGRAGTTPWAGGGAVTLANLRARATAAWAQRRCPSPSRDVTALSGPRR